MNPTILQREPAPSDGDGLVGAIRDEEIKGKNIDELFKHKEY